jgi:hypothetical protein
MSRADQHSNQLNLFSESSKRPSSEKKVVALGAGQHRIVVTAQFRDQPNPDELAAAVLRIVDQLTPAEKQALRKQLKERAKRAA